MEVQSLVHHVPGACKWDSEPWGEQVVEGLGPEELKCPATSEHPGTADEASVTNTVGDRLS